MRGPIRKNWQTHPKEIIDVRQRIDLDARERLIRQAHALPRLTAIGSARAVLIAPGTPGTG